MGNINTPTPSFWLLINRHLRSAHSARVGHMRTQRVRKGNVTLFIFNEAYRSPAVWERLVLYSTLIPRNYVMNDACVCVCVCACLCCQGTHKGSRMKGHA